MASRLINAQELEHRPARSGTPTAWMALAILAALITGWLFFDSMVCAALRLGLTVVAWNQGMKLSIDHLALTEQGNIRAQSVTLSFGAPEHHGFWKSAWIEIQPPSLGDLLGLANKKHQHLIRKVMLGRTKLLVDPRGETASQDTASRLHLRRPLSWVNFLPDALTAGPVDLVVIGENTRLSLEGLTISLPNQWVGQVGYTEALLAIGSAHHRFPATRASASWNGKTLRFGQMAFGKELRLEDLSLTPRGERLEFGVRGIIGTGLLRGDGGFGLLKHSTLEVTMVGENLKMETLSTLLRENDQRASGTIRQGRFTFRGDPARPLEADSSLRLVADTFRWEGRGWDSLRLAATLTGRELTLSELILHQKENEVVAQGQSKLPEDWHAALRAPFTATFHASLEDAGALASLVDPDFAQLSGSLTLEGQIKGAENKAEGYCNLLGTEMKLHNLPLNWLKGCLLFEGEKTRLSNLEAWSGTDQIRAEGVVENNRPHTYSATAHLDVGNLTKRLAQLGVSTAAQIGGGAVQGTWAGDGSSKGHSGSFQAKVKEWVSPWTSAGMSGSFEGTYSPDHLYCSKAEFQQQDLRLALQLSASPTRLEAKSIVATRGEKTDPLVQGDFSLPINAPALWQSGDVVSNLAMGEPLGLHLALHEMKVEELANLLGQKIPCTGTLDGEVKADGTPGRPELHATMKITRLALPNAPAPIGLIWNFDATAGRATTSLVQEPNKETSQDKDAKDSPLTLHADLPFLLVASQGALHMAGSLAPVHGVVALHEIPLNGWLALWNRSTGILRDGLLDGSLMLNGSVDNPTLTGNLLLSAHEVILSDALGLGNLKLPITCSMNKATATGGTALYVGEPVHLSGSLDWSNIPWEGRLKLSGADFSFPKICGLQSHGDADVLLHVQGTNPPLLTGNLMIKNIQGALPLHVTPFFAPPGVSLSSPPLFSSTLDNTVSQQAQLDLLIKTEGSLPLNNSSPSDPVEIQGDLHLQGMINALHWTGAIISRNAVAELPAGHFFIPEARLQCGDARQGDGREMLSFTAYGLTQYGFCTLQQHGETQNSAPSFDLLAATSGVTAPDTMLALATPEKNMSGSLLLQTPSWIRQNKLFPVPPLGWITSRLGESTSDAFGFYGNPWSFNLRSVEDITPSLQQDQKPSKN